MNNAQKEFNALVEGSLMLIDKTWEEKMQKDLAAQTDNVCNGMICYVKKYEKNRRKNNEKI